MASRGKNTGGGKGSKLSQQRVSNPEVAWDGRKQMPSKKNKGFGSR